LLLSLVLVESEHFGIAGMTP